MIEENNPRAVAAALVTAVTREGVSLSRLIPRLQSGPLSGRDRAFARAIAVGTLRYWPRLDWLTRQLLSKPLRRGSERLAAVIAIGLYQIAHMRVAGHAAVAETVAVARGIGGKGAGGLVNAVLRRYQRERGEWDARVQAHEVARLAHPQWWLEALRRDWPGDWEGIAEADNARAPMWLRVNRQRCEVAAYRALLQAELEQDAAGSAWAEHALMLPEPVDVEALPGFADGLVSVQDAAAQLSAALLPLRPGLRVLDACAAPGGKAAHLLERCPGIELLAIDVDEARLVRVSETLQRLGLEAGVLCADATLPDAWWDGRPFDAILLDAPCTGSGVVRRHPDIKVLRRPQDIAGLAAQQAALLEALWPLLGPGGTLVYCTCSVFARENREQVQRFLDDTDDALPQPMRTASGDEVSWGIASGPGRQVLPGADDMDGFYYACMSKRIQA